MYSIPAAEKSKLAGEERIVPGIISPPTQQKAELFQAKQLSSIYYSNDNSEGQREKIFLNRTDQLWGGFCWRDHSQTCESPCYATSTQRTLMSHPVLPQGSAFSLVKTLHTRCVPAPSPGSVEGTALLPGHWAGTLPLLQGSRSFTAPLHPHHAPPSSTMLVPSSWCLAYLITVDTGVFFCWRMCWCKGHSCNLSLCKPRPLNLMGLHESPRKWGLHLRYTWSSEDKKIAMEVGGVQNNQMI